MSDPFLEEALALDASDPLRHHRSAFAKDPSIIYLDGNSLGLLPKRSMDKLNQVVEQQWGMRAIRAWNEGWIDLPVRLGAKIASLIGAEPDEVLVCDSTTVNFYKLVMAALAQTMRTKIVSHEATFPTNAYVIQGSGVAELCLVPSVDGVTVPPETVEAQLDSRTALLTLNHVTFKSGWVHDMARLTRSAHKAGALTLWDLSHSAGVVPIDLNGVEADLAVGCTYKYLHGGPGAPAFLYVRRDLQKRLQSPIQGWFGQRDPFAFGLDYEPKDGVLRFMAGTPPVISMAGIEGGLDLITAAGIPAIRAKSEALTDFMIRLWKDRLEVLGVSLRSPSKPSDRGSHVSLGHPKGLPISRALIEEMNVIPDFRQPDNIRFGFAPLQNSYQDAYEAVQRLQRVIQHRLFERYEMTTSTVT